MRRNLSFILLIVMLLSSVLLSGCGSKTEVPDGVIELAVQDELDWATSLQSSFPSYVDPDYDRYKYVVDHEPNKDAHTDAVTVTLQLSYPYGDRILIGKQTYQYSRSDDLWSEMNWFWEWDELSSTIDSDSITRTWERDFPINYTIIIDSIDFESGTVTCSYDFYFQNQNYADSGTFHFESNTLKIVEADATFILEFSPEHGVQVDWYST